MKKIIDGGSIAITRGFYDFGAREREASFKVLAAETDYAALVVGRDQPRLMDLIGAFGVLAGQLKYDRERLLAAVTAFCLEIPYRIPPDEQHGLTIDGLIVPIQVAVDNWGDCDSKSLLFAAIWNGQTGERILLILVHGHMLAAVPGRPRYSTETGIEYEGHPYICLEPVGPAKWRPGSITDDSVGHISAGNFQVIPVD
jgi:hypothetical protein